MKSKYLLTFYRETSDFPRSTLKEESLEPIELSIGYDISDFISKTLSEHMSSPVHPYFKMNFLDSDIKTCYTLLSVYFSFAKAHKTDFFTLNYFDAFIAAFDILLPRQSVSFIVEKEIMRLLSKLSLEDEVNPLYFGSESALAQKLVIKTREIDYYAALKDDDSKILTYHCDNLTDVVFATIYHILSNDYTFKRCGICNQWFIPSVNKNEDFCDRISPLYPDKTCKQANIHIKSLNRVNNSQVQLLQKRIYNKFRTAAEVNPEKVEVFEKFKIDMEFQKQEIKKGVKTEAAYIAWLNSHYTKKKKS